MKLVVDHLEELEFVSVRTRPSTFRAVRMALDFQIHAPSEGLITGAAGDWVVDKGNGLDVLSPAEFKRDYQVIRPKKEKEQPRG